VYIELADFPVAARGEQRIENTRAVRTGDRTLAAQRARQRQPEHAEAVGHADAEMDRQRRRRHQPAVEARLGDNAFAIEKTDAVAPNSIGCGVCCRHGRFPRIIGDLTVP
jgi:hypothetical protein